MEIFALFTGWPTSPAWQVWHSAPDKSQQGSKRTDLHLSPAERSNKRKKCDRNEKTRTVFSQRHHSVTLDRGEVLPLLCLAGVPNQLQFPGKQKERRVPGSLSRERKSGKFQRTYVTYVCSAAQRRHSSKALLIILTPTNKHGSMEVHRRPRTKTL